MHDWLKVLSMYVFAFMVVLTQDTSTSAGQLEEAAAEAKTLRDGLGKLERLTSDALRQEKEVHNTVEMISKAQDVADKLAYQRQKMQDAPDNQLGLSSESLAGGRGSSHDKMKPSPSEGVDRQLDEARQLLHAECLQKMERDEVARQPKHADDMALASARKAMEKDMAQALLQSSEKEKELMEGHAKSSEMDGERFLAERMNEVQANSLALQEKELLELQLALDKKRADVEKSRQSLGAEGALATSMLSTKEMSASLLETSEVKRQQELLRRKLTEDRRGGNQLVTLRQPCVTAGVEAVPSKPVGMREELGGCGGASNVSVPVNGALEPSVVGKSILEQEANDKANGTKPDVSAHDDVGNVKPDSTGLSDADKARIDAENECRARHIATLELQYEEIRQKLNQAREVSSQQGSASGGASNAEKEKVQADPYHGITSEEELNKARLAFFRLFV